MPTNPPAPAQPTEAVIREWIAWARKHRGSENFGIRMAARKRHGKLNKERCKLIAPKVGGILTDDQETRYQLLEDATEELIQVFNRPYVKMYEHMLSMIPDTPDFAAHRAEIQATIDELNAEIER